MTATGNGKSCRSRLHLRVPTSLRTTGAAPTGKPLKRLSMISFSIAVRSTVMSVSHRSTRRAAGVVRAIDRSWPHAAGKGCVVSGRADAARGWGRPTEFDQLGSTPRRLLGHLISHAGQDLDRIRRQAIGLVEDLIRQPLMMDARRIDRLLWRHAVV